MADLCENDNVTKFPISMSERQKNEMGPGFVPCMISERWIQFPEVSTGHFGGGEFIEISIMTKNSKGKQREICNLIVTREDLLSALSAVKDRGAAPHK